MRFENQRETIPLFYEVYIQLKRKGVFFPKNHDESEDEKSSDESEAPDKA